MAHPRCLAHPSPVRALHRILISDLSAPATRRQQTASYLLPPRLATSFPLPRALPRAHPAKHNHHQHIRALHTTPALRRVLPAKYRVPQVRQRPANYDIPYDWVYVASDEGLGEPRPLAEALATVDMETHSLVMVAPPRGATTTSSDEPESEPESEYDDPPDPSDPSQAAICRVIDNETLAAEAAAQAAALAALRRRSAETKELELSWGIAAHDLSHKLKKLREFLSKGLEVEVLLAKKRRGKQATADEAQALLAAIRAVVAEVDGAAESRKMDGGVGGVAKLFFKGPVGRRKKKKGQLQQEEEQEKVQEQEQEPGSEAAVEEGRS